MKRRNFLKASMEIAAASLGALLMTSCNNSTSPSTDSQTINSMTASTGPSHTHTITIKKSEVETPAAISRETSSSSGHTHTFSMTQAQLQSVKDGNNQTITTAANGSPAHTHDFVISKWY